MILLTLSRKPELLLARWGQRDLETGECLIPEENAKMGKPHIVYLGTQVAGIFRELKTMAGNSKRVMPGRGSVTRSFAANALNKALEGTTFDMDQLTIHNLRGTGATLLTEHGFNRDVLEKALRHEAVGIRAVYTVAEYAEQRKNAPVAGRLRGWQQPYQNSTSSRTRLPQRELPDAESPTAGRHKNRFCRFSESRVKRMVSHFLAKNQRFRASRPYSTSTLLS
jgi:hypothetical protein